MFARFFNWIKRERAWNRSHSLAWHGWTKPEADGWSRWQRSCESAVTRKLYELQRTVSERREHRGEECHIETKIAESDLTLWIYADGANLDGHDVDIRLEYWDAESPALLCDKFCSALENALLRPRAGAV